MRKFIFSSKQNEFVGSFYLIYNSEGIIQVIDFADCDLPAIKRQLVGAKCPRELTVEGLKAFVDYTRTQCIESTITYSFDDFWSKYSKKINKKRCIPLWNKLTPGKQASAVIGIEKYDKYLKTNPWRTKADPENYLRNEMWDNEWN